MKKLILIFVLLLSGCAATGPLTPVKFNTNDAETLPVVKPKVEIPPPKDGKVVVGKDGKPQQDCKTIKVHKKLEGTEIPAKK